MSKTFSSWNELKKAIQKEVKDATEEVTDLSFKNLHENVDYFYSAPAGKYHRTGQLAESPEMQLYGSGDSYVGELSLDTTYKYYPAGRTTDVIYGYAENDGLLGRGGFWQKTQYDIENNINEVFGKKFQKQ